MTLVCCNGLYRSLHTSRAVSFGGIGLLLVGLLGFWAWWVGGRGGGLRGLRGGVVCIVACIDGIGIIYYDDDGYRFIIMLIEMTIKNE